MSNDKFGSIIINNWSFIITLHWVPNGFITIMGACYRYGGHLWIFHCYRGPHFFFWPEARNFYRRPWLLSIFIFLLAWVQQRWGNLSVCLSHLNYSPLHCVSVCVGISHADSRHGGHRYWCSERDLDKRRRTSGDHTQSELKWITEVPVQNFSHCKMQFFK